MEQYNRNHILTVIDDIISSLIKSIVPIAVLFLGKLREKDGSSWGAILTWAILLTIIFFSVLSAFIKWYKSGYYINRRFIVLRSGLFVVKRREIPFNKIQTINISQNIIQRLFRLAELKIDTGNSSYNASELSVRIGKAEAERIRETILYAKEGSAGADAAVGPNEARPNETGQNEAGPREAGPAETGTFRKAGKAPAVVFTLAGRELLLAGLTSNAIFAGLAFFASLYGLLNDYLSSVIESSLARLEHYIGSLDFAHMTTTRIITLVLAAFLIFLLFSVFLSILGTFVKYYGFTVKREEKLLSVNYGLLEKKSFILPVQKIKAVYVKQNLLRQFAGLSAIHVESIGYGNEKGEEAVLFPLASGKTRAELIERLLPEYIFGGEMVPVPKNTLRRFVLSKTMLPLIVCMVPAFLFPYGWLGFLLLPFFVLAGCLEYRNSAVGRHGSLVCLNNGSFTKSSSMIAIRDIQSVSERSNFLQRRKGLFHFIVSIQSNQFGHTIQVRNLADSMKRELMNLVLPG